MAGKKDAKEIPSVETDYDPYEYRNVENPTKSGNLKSIKWVNPIFACLLLSDLESVAHIMKSILGTGVLAIPEGFSYVGGVMAIIYCLLSGVICTAGTHILVTGFYMVCKAHQLPVVSYKDAMKLGIAMGPAKLAKFNKIFAILTDALIIIFQVGLLCVYMLFAAVTAKTVTNHLVEKDIPIAYYLLLLVIPCMLINCLKNLKILAPVSYFSLAVTIMAIALIFYYAFRDGLPPFSDRKYYNSFTKLPMFFGTTMFSFTSVAVVVAVENNMEHPARFHILYDISLSFLIMLHLMVGFFSYWKWGEDLKPVVILNLPHDETAAVAANYLYALAIYLSLGLKGIVPVKLLMDAYILKELESPYPVMWEYMLRLGCIALGLVAAITIPHIGIMISLLGAVSTSFLALIFPSILDICWRHQQGYGKLKFRLIIDIFMISYGILGLTTAIYVNAAALYMSEDTYK